MTAIATTGVAEACERAKRASRELATASTATKDAALERLAELLAERTDEVLEANAADLADERAAGLTDALRDRLTLTAERVAAMADGCARSPPFRIRWARRSSGGRSRVASTSARCVCRWGSSP